jgi:hypothetical protein
MENKYVTRQELANEFGLNVKALMKRLHKNNIFPDERERISPAMQREIRKVIYKNTEGPLRFVRRTPQYFEQL